MNYCGYIPESINEGKGLRAVIFVSGCIHQCEGCHSVNTWDFNAGKPFDEIKQMEIINDIRNNPILEGITLCGGDPFCNAKDCNDFITLFRSYFPKKTVWVYTGFTYEEIISGNSLDMINLLKNTDVLIDGRFILEQKDLTLRFRGSKNQRVIDVYATQLYGEIVLI